MMVEWGDVSLGIKSQTDLIPADITAALDTILPAVKTKTDTIPASPAAVGSAMTLNTAEHNRLLVTHANANPLTTGTLFTIAGSVAILAIIGRFTTQIAAAATTIKMSIATDVFAALDICTAGLDINAFTVGSLLSIDGTLTDAMVGVKEQGIAAMMAVPLVVTCVSATGAITVTFGAASAGAITWEVLWVPLNVTGSVT